jgi:hypothetical protein
MAGSNSEQQEQGLEDVGAQQDSLEQLVQRHMKSLADLVYVSALKGWMSSGTRAISTGNLHAHLSPRAALQAWYKQPFVMSCCTCVQAQRLPCTPAHGAFPVL